MKPILKIKIRSPKDSRKRGILRRFVLGNKALTPLRQAHDRLAQGKLLSLIIEMSCHIERSRDVSEGISQLLGFDSAQPDIGDSFVTLNSSSFQLCSGQVFRPDIIGNLVTSSIIENKIFCLKMLSAVSREV